MWFLRGILKLPKFLHAQKSLFIVEKYLEWFANYITWYPEIQDMIKFI